MKNNGITKAIAHYSAIFLSAVSLLLSVDANAAGNMLEVYPDRVKASKEAYHQSLAKAGRMVTSVPFYLILPTTQRWEPGQIVRVAFNGGDAALHQKIADAAAAWVNEGGANLTLSFRDSSGQFRIWSSADTNYMAEIRIAFQSGPMGGYWSHVGTDSANSNVFGGRAGEASMNLDSFDKRLPSDWRAVVIHEFGHAIGFKHEHQSPTGGCDFRFEDDPAYVQTMDSDGAYINDSNDKRPGLYTYLGGHPNYWPKAKVDYNLKTISVSSAFLVGPFDRFSVMKYFFGAFMFEAAAQSPCYTQTENLTLSQQDIVGVKRAYPRDAASMANIRIERRTTFEQLLKGDITNKALVLHINKQLEAR